MLNDVGRTLFVKKVLLNQNMLHVYVFWTFEWNTIIVKTLLFMMYVNKTIYYTNAVIDLLIYYKTSTH